MRKWIDLFEQPLQLSRGHLAPLYHGTSVGSVLEMLKLETFWRGSSLTRSYRTASHFSAKTSEKLHDANIGNGAEPLDKLEFEADLGTSAIIAFDQVKLRNSVGLYPFDWFYHNTNAYDRSQPYSRGTEFEEVTTRDAKPISRYILGIEQTGFEEFSKIVVEALPEYAEAVEKMRGLIKPTVHHRYLT